MIPFILNLMIAIVACSAIVMRPQDIVLRTGLVISVVCASLISFWLITLYAGKPVVKTLPDDIIVYGHAINIDEQKIYIMYKVTSGGWPPTMIDVEYSKELKEVLKEGANQSGGKPFRMKKNEQGGEAGGQQGEGKDGEGSEGEQDGGGSLSSQSDTWNIMPLPPPRLPDK